jgi:pyroglutamyl-peptidase
MIRAKNVILVTGFGPFKTVVDNPSAAVVRQISGARVAGRTVVGLELPVSFARAPGLVLDAARRLDVDLVVGFGVAMSRDRVCVERRAARPAGSRSPDVDGVSDYVVDGPDLALSTADTATLAAAMGAALSDDAGSYVCNAWLYEVSLGLPDVPVAFVHVPPAGIEASRVLDGLAALVAGGAPVRVGTIR